MLWTPQVGEVQVVSNSGAVGSATPWTAVVSGATADTYGTVTELISAAANVRDNWGIQIVITGSGASATAAQASVDILIGGATDDVLISSLLCGYAYQTSHVSYLFPLHVPEGVRIAARASSVRLSASLRVACYLYGGGVPPWKVGRKVVTYGTKINNSRGQAVAPGASGAAMTSTQMTASTSQDHFAFMLGLQPATDTTITPNGYVNTQIGVGAATEDRIGPNYWWGKDTTEQWSGPWPSFPTFQKVPSGTRLALLASNSGANDAAYDGHIYAVA